MRDDFAIFILTHGRAENQVSYNALRNAGYTGKVYFVVDNLDDQIPKYKELYGDDVLIFDKEEEYKKTDTFICEKNLLAVVYARNACFELAKAKGVKWFVNCDDDIIRFFYRIPVNGKLSCVKIKNMDAVIEAFIDFMEGASIDCMSIAENGIYIGGINQKVLDGCQWSFTHFFLFNADSDLRFRSVWVEDIVFSVEKLKLGKRILSSTMISQEMPSLDSVNKHQTGGMREAYSNSSNWVTAYVPLITAPDCCKVNFKDGLWKTTKKNNNLMVKILSERWKK